MIALVLAIVGAIGLFALYSYAVWSEGFVSGVRECQKRHEIIRYDLTK